MYMQAGPDLCWDIKFSDEIETEIFWLVTRKTVRNAENFLNRRGL
jgi:hypothetical protein